MIDDLFDVARSLIKVPDLHNVVVTDCHTIIFELTYGRHWSTSSITRDDLILMLLFIDFHQLEAIVITSSQKIALVLATLKLDQALDLTFLMNLTFEIHLQLLHVPDGYLTLGIGHCHELLLSLAMMLQMNYVGDR